MTALVSNRRVWGSWAAGGFAAAFLFVDALGKLVKLPAVIDASVRLGYGEQVLVPLGAVLMACTVIYIVPRTAVWGAILLTGYLGGAVATHVRVGDSLFSTLFPGIIATLAWGGIWLRDERLRQLVRFQ